jgi:hypothetical protein
MTEEELPDLVMTYQELPDLVITDDELQDLVMTDMCRHECMVFNGCDSDLLRCKCCHSGRFTSCKYCCDKPYESCDPFNVNSTHCHVSALENLLL